MHRRVGKGQPRDLPEEPCPDEQAEVPAQQDELEHRQGDEEVPPAGEPRPQGRALGYRVPGRHLERHVRPPEDQHADDVDEGEDQDLGAHGVAQLARARQRGVEARPDLVGHEALRGELADHDQHALVDDAFRQISSGARPGSAPARRSRTGTERRRPCRWPCRRPTQDQQRQPGEEGNEHDPPAHQLERVTGQAGAPEQLEQRTAEDQREVLRLRGLLRHGAIPGERYAARRARHPPPASGRCPGSA